jgi:polysaccharide pyruvyl transferase WcaK-like protein
VDILFTVSQIMDMKVSLECVQKSRYQSRIKIVGNCDYTYQELTGLLSKVDVHAGLRTHTLIFSSAVGTPSISINAYPKSAGFIKTVGLGDWNIDFEDLSVGNLTAIMTKAWNDREGLAATMEPIVKLEKQKSRDSVTLVTNILDLL